MPKASAVDDLADWLTALGRPATLVELGALLVCVGLAWTVVWVTRRSLQNTDRSSILFGRSLEISTRTLAGDLFSLFAGVCYAFYLIPLQTARGTLGNWSLLAWSSLASAPLLLAIALALGEPIWPTTWWPVIGLALSSQVLGQGLLVYSLKHFRPLVIGLMLLTQPVIGVLAGWLAFDEAVGGVDLLGMALVASALVIARASEKSA